MASRATRATLQGLATTQAEETHAANAGYVKEKSSILFGKSTTAACSASGQGVSLAQLVSFAQDMFPGVSTEDIGVWPAGDGESIAAN